MAKKYDIAEKGAFYCNKAVSASVKAYDVKTVDTTGAGDAFFGAALQKLKALTRQQPAEPDDNRLKEIVEFANAAGSLATTQKGAIPALPDYEDIAKLLKEGERLG